MATLLQSPNYSPAYNGGASSPIKKVNAKKSAYDASIYGTRVAPITMPNPAGDLGGVYKNLGATNNSISDLITSQLKGQLSPDTIDAIRNQGAAWGVGAGVPQSQFSTNNMVKNLGLNSMAIQQKGVDNYNQTIPTISKTQTVDPSLQSEINFQNNVSAAAPDPAAAGKYAQTLFQSYLDKLSGTSTNQPKFKPAGTPLGPTQYSFGGSSY